MWVCVPALISDLWEIRRIPWRGVYSGTWSQARWRNHVQNKWASLAWSQDTLCELWISRLQVRVMRCSTFLQVCVLSNAILSCDKLFEKHFYFCHLGHPCASYTGHVPWWHLHVRTCFGSVSAHMVCACLHSQSQRRHFRQLPRGVGVHPWGPRSAHYNRVWIFVGSLSPRNLVSKNRCWIPFFLYIRCTEIAFLGHDRP